MKSTEDSQPTTCKTPRTAHVFDAIGRYWYYFGIAAMFLIGWARPSIGHWMKSVGTTPYLVAFAFFMNGFALSTESLLGSLKKWRVLCVSLPITFVISPAIVFAARAILPGGDSLIAHGFQIVSLLPTLFVSAVLITRMAKGNAAVALYLTIASNLIAIVVAPMLIKLTLPGSSTQLDLASTTVSMIFTVLIPTILGQLARKKWEVWAGSHARLITVISQCTILIFIITGVSALPRSVLTPSVVTTAVVGGIILHAALIGVSRIGGMVVRADERTKRALTFCCAQKSFVFNVLLCEHTFGGNSKAFGLAILPGIVYYLLVLTVDSIIAQWWSARIPADEASYEETTVGSIGWNEDLVADARKSQRIGVM